jgi:hypothetical protein
MVKREAGKIHLTEQMLCLLTTWLLVFIIHINDHPATVRIVSEPMKFANDTSVIISHNNFGELCTVSYIILFDMRTWFTANKLALNLCRTNA